MYKRKFIGLIHRYLMRKTSKEIVPSQKTDIDNPTACIDNKNSKTKNKFVIAYYGITGKEQNSNLMLEAYKALKDEITGIELLIMGNDEFMSNCKVYVDENKIKDVRFIDIQIENPVKNQLLVADILVLTDSPNETKPKSLASTILKAMTLSMPIIASDAMPEVQTIIRDGENGFIYESGSADSLHAALGSIVSNGILYRKMCHCAKRTVLKGKKFLK
jgi:glycosyltransferase involved in cell wall biosynthesis